MLPHRRSDEDPAELKLLFDPNLQHVGVFDGKRRSGKYHGEDCLRSKNNDGDVLCADYGEKPLPLPPPPKDEAPYQPNLEDQYY